MFCFQCALYMYYTTVNLLNYLLCYFSISMKQAVVATKDKFRVKSSEVWMKHCTVLNCSLSYFTDSQWECGGQGCVSVQEERHFWQSQHLGWQQCKWVESLELVRISTIGLNTPDKSVTNWVLHKSLTLIYELYIQPEGLNVRTNFKTSDLIFYKGLIRVHSQYCGIHIPQSMWFTFRFALTFCYKGQKPTHCQTGL